jgi:hypothetical protein
VPEIRRADPAARRQAVAILIVGTVVGALLILAFERYRPVLRDWLGSDPRAAASRARLLLAALAGAVSLPLLAFAFYCWRLGASVLRTAQYPPPGRRVARDATVLEGAAAVRRGRAFRIMGVGLGVMAIGLWLVLWRLARALAPRGP